ncbi:hypothetical protein TNCV_2447091, partial [Trichonephila clavipes]
LISRPSGIAVSDTDFYAVGPGITNPGEDMDVFKCIVSSRHGSILNSFRKVGGLGREVGGP